MMKGETHGEYRARPIGEDISEMKIFEKEKVCDAFGESGVDLGTYTRVIENGGVHGKHQLMILFLDPEREVSIDRRITENHFQG